MVGYPYFTKSYLGRIGYSYKRCPYSTYDVSNRVPSGERGIHSDTDGRMSATMGPAGIQYICESDYCPYYLGNAITAIEQAYTKEVVVSGQLTIVEVTEEIPLCSGIRFTEY